MYLLPMVETFVAESKVASACRKTKTQLHTTGDKLGSQSSNVQTFELEVLLSTK